MAKGFCLQCFTIDDPARCAEALGAALSAPDPALVEAVVDPHEPPMPLKVALKQTGHLAESLVRGTPEPAMIALTITSDVVRELI